MRFRFTIRDLLWLTLVVALVVAWRIDRSHYAAPSYWNGIPKEGQKQIRDAITKEVERKQAQAITQSTRQSQ